MKRLKKNFKQNRNTIQMYSCTCPCTCACNFCAGTWQSQSDADGVRSFKLVTVGPTKIGV